jgi:hypothetical protein
LDYKDLVIEFIAECASAESAAVKQVQQLLSISSSWC